MSIFRECIACSHLGATCDGPNFVAMTSIELIEWCKLRKSHLGLSNAKLADMSGTPKGTIDRLFSAEPVDYKFETIRPMVKALVGGSWQGSPCPITPAELEAEREQYETTIETLQAKNANLKERLAQSEQQHRKDIEEIRAEAHDNAMFLREQLKYRRRTSIILGTLFIVSLVTIIIALLCDKINPDVGFFWLEP